MCIPFHDFGSIGAGHQVGFGLFDHILCLFYCSLIIELEYTNVDLISLQLLFLF